MDAPDELREARIALDVDPQQPSRAAEDELGQARATMEQAAEGCQHKRPHIDVSGRGMLNDGDRQLTPEARFRPATAGGPPVPGRDEREIEHRGRREGAPAAFLRLLGVCTAARRSEIRREGCEVLEVEAGRLRPVHHSELSVDRCEVELDRVHGHVQLPGDLRVR